MKKYVLEVTEDEDGKLHFRGECTGFLSFEVLGFLEFKVDDILRQIRGEIRPDTITRIVIKDGEV